MKSLARMLAHVAFVVTLYLAVRISERMFRSSDAE